MYIVLWEYFNLPPWQLVEICESSGLGLLTPIFSEKNYPEKLQAKQLKFKFEFNFHLGFHLAGFCQLLKISKGSCRLQMQSPLRSNISVNRLQVTYLNLQAIISYV